MYNINIVNEIREEKYETKNKNNTHKRTSMSRHTSHHSFDTDKHDVFITLLEWNNLLNDADSNSVHFEELSRE